MVVIGGPAVVHLQTAVVVVCQCVCRRVASVGVPLVVGRPVASAAVVSDAQLARPGAGLGWEQSTYKWRPGWAVNWSPSRAVSVCVCRREWVHSQDCAAESIPGGPIKTRRVCRPITLQW